MGLHDPGTYTGNLNTRIMLHEESGLKHAMRILSGIHGIAQITFGATDVLRHPLVKDILLAYEQKEKRK